jgi:hypothetical protein
MVGSPALKKQVIINEKRFQTLMRDIRNDVVRTTKNSKNLDSWIHKLGGIAVTNPFVTGKYSKQADDIVNNILKGTTHSPLPKGGMHEIVKGVMSENTMHYVTKLGDDMKTDLRKIAVQSYDKGLAPRDIAKEMASKVDSLSISRARTIARTETMRASNLSNYSNAMLNMGAQSFTVDSAPDCCPICAETYNYGATVFDISQNDMIPPLHPNCYDKYTEVFTNNGWKLIRDVVSTDLILSMNPKTHEVEFIPFIQKIEYHHIGEIYHIHNKWFDMKITPDHDVYTEKRVDHGKLGRSLEPFFVKPSKLHSEHRIPRTCEYNKKSPEFIDINGIRFKPKDYAFFMAWFISEGSILHNKEDAKARGYPIKITQHIKENKELLKNVLSKICNSIGLNLSIQKYGFEIYSKGLYDYLIQLGRSNEKYIPKEMYSLSKEHINLFLNNYILGDGHERKQNNNLVQNSSERQVFTSSKRLADDLSYLILLAGFYPSFSIDKNKNKEIKFKNGTYKLNNDIYRISINKSKHANISNSVIDILDYDDMVYCLELPKWHTLWIKSNNKTSWGGNCRCVAMYSTKSPTDLGMDQEQTDLATAKMVEAKAILANNGLKPLTPFNELFNKIESVCVECGII